MHPVKTRNAVAQAAAVVTAAALVEWVVRTKHPFTSVFVQILHASAGPSEAATQCRPIKAERTIEADRFLNTYNIQRATYLCDVLASRTTSPVTQLTFRRASAVHRLTSYDWSRAVPQRLAFASVSYLAAPERPPTELYFWLRALVSSVAGRQVWQLVRTSVEKVPFNSDEGGPRWRLVLSTIKRFTLGRKAPSFSSSAECCLMTRERKPEKNEIFAIQNQSISNY